MINRLKKWIFNHKIFADLHREQYIKAFTAASKDLEESRIDDTDKRAKELSDKMLNDMLSIVDENKIISVTPRGIVYLGGEMADEAYLMNLKSEAEMIESTNMWTILHETPKKLAQETMFVKGETLADMQKGRTMLFTLATQKKILDTVKSYKPKAK